MALRRFDRLAIRDGTPRLWWRNNAVFTGVLVTLLPRLARACPACFAASNERVLPSYYLTAAFMTLVPLVIVGVFARWLRQRFRDAPK